MSKIIYPPVGGIKVFPSNQPNVEKKEPKVSCYERFINAKETWGYSREAIKITQGVMNGAGGVINEIKPVTTEVSDKLSFLSILTIPFAIDNVITGAQKLVSGAKIKDYSGVSLAGMGTLLNLGDIFSTSISFINTVYKVIGLPTIKVLGRISPILGISLCSLSIVSRNFQIYNHAKFKWKISKIDLADEEKTRKIFNSMIAKDSRLKELEAKNSDPTMAIQKYKAKKIAILNRALNGELVQEIRHIQEKVLTKETLTDDDKNGMKKTLRRVDHLIFRKIFSGVVSVAITGGTLAALVVVLLNAAPVLIVGSAFTILACCKLGLMIYENKFINKKL